jgi:hypothetical protein
LRPKMSLVAVEAMVVLKLKVKMCGVIAMARSSRQLQGHGPQEDRSTCFVHASDASQIRTRSDLLVQCIVVQCIVCSA